MNCSLTDDGHARTVRADAFVAQMHKAERAAVVRAIKHRDMAELERAGIAARIKQARKEAGLSQPEMAEAIGVIPRTYQNYESAKDPRTPWGLMNEIATITGKTTEWLIHGNGNGNNGTTPDLLAVPDQLHGVSSEFSVRVDNVEARLDRIEQALDETVELLRRLVRREDLAPPGELGRRARDPKTTAPGRGAKGRRRAADESRDSA